MECRRYAQRAPVSGTLADTLGMTHPKRPVDAHAERQRASGFIPWCGYFVRGMSLLALSTRQRVFLQPSDPPRLRPVNDRNGAAIQPTSRPERQVSFPQQRRTQVSRSGTDNSGAARRH